MNMRTLGIVLPAILVVAVGFFVGLGVAKSSYSSVQSGALSPASYFAISDLSRQMRSLVASTAKSGAQEGEKQAQEAAELEAQKKAEEEKLKAEEEAKARAKAEEEARAKLEAEAEAEQAALDESETASDGGGQSVQTGGQGSTAASQNLSSAPANLPIAQDFRSSFVHGDKGAQYQKYIVLHDTEGEGDAYSVINYWDGNGAGVAAHFVVNKDGSIVQCVALDKITHHAGFGDTGHNAAFGVEDESRDDKVGTTPIGSWAADYGMNSYSIGIEMVHVGGSGYYPEEQLAAVDALIAYIDSYYGFQSQIIDHKDWRSGNSDTSPEFAGYLANYKDHRTHN